MTSDDPRLISRARLDDDVRFDVSLRPLRLADYIGQKNVVDNLSVSIEAAKNRGEALDHILLFGPPGVGKTSLAHVIANELGVQIKTTSGPVVERAGDLAALLTALDEREILFIDEIHRLDAKVEEILYPALEDFSLDLMIGSGPGARSMRVPLKPFTLISATTRAGLLTAPLRSRFGIVLRLDLYNADDLEIIVTRSARLLGVPLDEAGAQQIARRSRGTPRIANRLLRRVRDFAQVRAQGHITGAVADDALKLLNVDDFGFDEVDRKLLLTIIDKFGGGPVGLGTLAASTGEEQGAIEDIYEPYLLQIGFIDRTPRGRVATQRAYRHFGLERPDPDRPQKKTVLKTTDFDYELPTELIAQSPLAERDASRLLVMNRQSGTTQHRGFSDLPDFLREGDLLVVNRSRVLPARLLGKLETGKDAEVFYLFPEPGEPNTFRALVRPGKKLKIDAVVILGETERCRVLGIHPDGSRTMRFEGTEDIVDVLQSMGHLPLPPYIARADEPLDRDRYQTVYAKEPGSVAAPTAGLHFTEALLQKLRDRGIVTAEIMLHVGPGTFSRVDAADVADHRVPPERTFVPDDTAEAFAHAKEKRRRVVAVGTTSVRTLESRVRANRLQAGPGETDLVVLPGHHFRAVDAIVTNFHLPKSSLLFLVAAFAGRESVLRAYGEAIRERYRFYSYGDAMLIH